MRSTLFNAETDLAPIPFDIRHCRMAARMKQAGLPWNPHVGCFVWDRDHHIEVTSPFPGRIYFILNLGHFLRLLGGLEEIKSKLIWLPTWYQARLLCSRLPVNKEAFFSTWNAEKIPHPGEDLLFLYETLFRALKGPNPTSSIPEDSQ